MHTGIRKGQLLDLIWKQVSLSERTITVERTKNDQHQSIPINADLMETLRGLAICKVMSQYVFRQADGDKYTTIDQTFRRAVKRAGIKDFKFHDLPYTFASWLVQAGVDISIVSKLVWHKSIQMSYERTSR